MCLKGFAREYYLLIVKSINLFIKNEGEYRVQKQRRKDPHLQLKEEKWNSSH